MTDSDARPTHVPGRTSIMVEDREVVLDQEGFLLESDDWTEAFALVLARQSGLDALTPDQWLVLRFLRKYYYHHGRAPLNKDLRARLELSLLALERMFPGGIKYGARRLAGLPNPKTCMG